MDTYPTFTLTDLLKTCCDGYDRIWSISIKNNLVGYKCMKGSIIYTVELIDDTIMKISSYHYTFGYIQFFIKSTSTKYGTHPKKLNMSLTHLQEKLKSELFLKLYDLYQKHLLKNESQK